MIEPEDKLKIPASLLSKLYDATGSQDGSNQGYFLFFINDRGEPAMTTRTSNQCVNVALQRTIDLYNQQHLE